MNIYLAMFALGAVFGAFLAVVLDIALVNEQRATYWLTLSQYADEIVKLRETVHKYEQADEIRRRYESECG